MYLPFTSGDGIFDQLNNEEVIKAVWMTTRDSHKCQDIHYQCGISVDMIIKSSLMRKTLDNVTCVMIAFENFQNFLFPSKFEKQNILKRQNSQKFMINTYTKNDVYKKVEPEYKKNGFYIDMNTLKHREYAKKISYEK
jgi:hypothetical protein